mgnify:CR=1 FL=1
MRVFPFTKEKYRLYVPVTQAYPPNEQMPSTLVTFAVVEPVVTVCTLAAEVCCVAGDVPKKPTGPPLIPIAVPSVESPPINKWVVTVLAGPEIGRAHV